MVTPTPTSPPSILLLDDDEALLDSLRLIAETLADRSTICARSLDEVIARQEEVLACESALLDINLGPGQPSGVEVYGWLQSKGFSRPINFLTGHGRGHPQVSEALKRGEVFSKPLEIDVLVRLMRGESL